MTDSLPLVHLCGLEYRGLDRAHAAVTLEDWHIRSFELEERLCEPYALRLSVAADDTDLCVAALVGGRCTLRVGRGEFERVVHGVVIKAEGIGVVRGTLRFRLWIGPSLELLALSRRLRCFQDKTALEIVAEVVAPVFARYGGALDDSRLVDTQLRVRDACVQHEESDLQFVQRLLAEEGIAFSFVHDHDDDDAHERCVLMPASACLHSAAGERERVPPVAPLRSTGFELAPVETIQSLRGSSRMRPAGAEVSMWDWKSAAPQTARCPQSSFGADQGLPQAPARYGEQHEHEPYRPVEEQASGPLYEQLQTEVAFHGHRSRIDDVQASGKGVVLGFTDGATFEVNDHPSVDLDGHYVVTAVTHTAVFDEITGGAEGGRAASYFNQFSGYRYQNPESDLCYDYVPPRRPKPRARGPITAVVVGPKGEEIHTDPYGRIKVRMHWDREGLARDDHDTSCWVPVSQLSGGPGYGAVFIPRVGMEVVITFLAGDPDRPLCTGVVYNGGNMPPYALPEHKTRSVIRTSSTPDGQGHNELSFEDAAGAEEVFLRAQRNLRETIRANHTTTVGVDQSLSVGRNRAKTLKGHEVVKISEYQQTTIEGARSLVIDGPEEVRVKCGAAKGYGSPSIFSAQSTLVVNGRRWVLADEEILLKVGPEKDVDANTGILITDDSVTIRAKKSFKVEVGGTVFELTPTYSETMTDTIKLRAKGSDISMDSKIDVNAQDAIVLKQSDACSLKLDGDARLNAAEVELGASGQAKLHGMSAIVEAATERAKIIGGQGGVSVTSEADVEVAADVKLKLTAPIVEAN